MNTFRPVPLLVAALIVGLGSLSAQAGPQTVVKNDKGNRPLPLTSYYEVAQRFSYDNGAGSYEVSRVELRLYRDKNAPLQDITVSIRETVNGPDLVSATVSSADLDKNWKWIDFDFAPILLNRDQDYYVVASSTLNSGVYARFSNKDEYSDGELYISGYPFTNFDLSFRIKGEKEPLPEAQFTLSASSGTEGGTLQVEFSLSFATVKDVRVEYEVTGGTAIPVDYLITPDDRVDIPAGSTSVTFSVALTDDGETEGDETIEISIDKVRDAVPGTQTTHTVTILDNEAPPPIDLVSGEAGAGPTGIGAALTVSTTGLVMDLIYTDAPLFGDGLSNTWQLAVRGNGPTFTDEGDVGRLPPASLSSSTLRFYRVAAEGAWTNTPKAATATVYAYKNVQLYPGQNWVKTWGDPDRNEIGRIFSHGLPAGTTPQTSTRVSWYDNGITVTPTNEIWLAEGATNEWRWSLGGVGSAEADPIPLNQGFVVTLPEDATPCTCPMIFRVPRNALSQSVAGNKAATLVGFNVPARMHPRDMNLLASGFRGGFIPPLSDRIWKYNRASQQVDNAVWYRTTDGTWRFTSTNFPLVPEGYFGADDALFISTQASPADWTWVNALPYTPPTADMNP